MNTVLAAENAAVTAGRAELTAAVYTASRDEAAIRAAVEKIRVAEIALATKRAEEFAKLQAGPNKLTPEQVRALIAAGCNPAAGGGRGGAGAAGAGRGN